MALHTRSEGRATAGGAEVAEIGPVPPLSAPEYLLRVNYGHGLPGAKTPVHSILAPKHSMLSLADWANGPRKE